MSSSARNAASHAGSASSKSKSALLKRRPNNVRWINTPTLLQPAGLESLQRAAAPVLKYLTDLVKRPVFGHLRWRYQRLALEHVFSTHIVTLKYVCPFSRKTNKMFATKVGRYDEECCWMYLTLHETVFQNTHHCRATSHDFQQSTEVECCIFRQVCTFVASRVTYSQIQQFNWI